MSIKNSTSQKTVIRQC